MTVPALTASTNQQQPQRTQWHLVAARIRRSAPTMAGLCIVTFFVLVALFAPLLTKHDPIKQNLRTALQPPSSQHIMGTDDFGRDMWSRLVYGSRISLQVGLVSVVIAGSVGVTLGLMAGYFGGITDTLISRFIDFKLAFPGILLALTIVAVLGPGLMNVMVAVGISAIPAYVRVARSVALSTREMDYVVAAHAMGGSHLRVIFRHILPSVIPSVIVLATLGIAGAILTAAALSFLGLGAQPPTPEWGAMLASGRKFMRQAWWVATFPGVAIMFLVLGINLLGDGLREITDPRLRR
jgi:peptide/nickel transport system permease protein